MQDRRQSVDVVDVLFAGALGLPSAWVAYHLFGAARDDLRYAVAAAALGVVVPALVNAGAVAWCWRQTGLRAFTVHASGFELRQSPGWGSLSIATTGCLGVWLGVGVQALRTLPEPVALGVVGGLLVYIAALLAATHLALARSQVMNVVLQGRALTVGHRRFDLHSPRDQVTQGADRMGPYLLISGGGRRASVRAAPVVLDELQRMFHELDDAEGSAADVPVGLAALGAAATSPEPP